ncbi:uncharacterized protein YbbK (DUF523 family) [Anaerobacterium chartisolvens]|uniref:Uncharacterized protein YbbK (DUF523 family) n=1 Tax=Anaerobacterium chartisolvens TaxID=1297424 RepID=A0A369BA49_9FIRM|nr:DUF523 domain-containing protein [Anaerobacterium chartisolvens]RCX18403.1 uncharacterized protein YbbK (DUF523 family) [Anaerobacterium chartisolvens]
MVIVSACLAGVKCKYNGKSNFNSEAEKLVKSGKAVPVCPEQMGGCPTPRLKAEILNGTGADVLDGKCIVVKENGENATQEFIKGAEEVLKIALLTGAKRAVLKSGSPSCGCGSIYDGSFSGNKIKGNGVTSELLIRNGIEVVSEERLNI